MRKVRLIGILLAVAFLILGGYLLTSRRTAPPSKPPVSGTPEIPAPPVDPTPEPEAAKPAPATPAAPAEDAMLTGRVIDSNAAPVAGAVVRLVDFRYYGDIMVAGKARPKAYTTVTNDLGEFRFEKVTRGPKRLGAEHPDHPAGGVEPFELKGGENKIIRLPAPVILSGTLTPPNATVTIAYRFPAEKSPRASFTAQGNPKAGGTYRFDRLPSRVPLHVKVDAPDHVTKTFGPYTFEPGETRLDFALEAGAALVGTVRTLAGEPVAGASVILGQSRTTTDEAGAFVIGGLPEDRVNALIVSKEGHLQVVINDVKPGRRDITLPRGVTVSGRVEGGDGLFVCYRSGTARVRNRLGKSGDFTLSAVPPGRTKLEVETGDRRVVASLEINGLEGGELKGVVIRVP